MFLRMETVPHLTVPQMFDSLQDNGCREKVDRARLSKCFCLGCTSMISACNRGPAEVCFSGREVQELVGIELCSVSVKRLWWGRHPDEN